MWSVGKDQGDLSHLSNESGQTERRLTSRAIKSSDLLEVVLQLLHDSLHHLPLALLGVVSLDVREQARHALLEPVRQVLPDERLEVVPLCDGETESDGRTRSGVELLEELKRAEDLGPGFVRQVVYRRGGRAKKHPKGTLKCQLQGESK